MMWVIPYWDPCVWVKKTYVDYWGFTVIKCICCLKQWSLLLLLCQLILYVLYFNLGVRVQFSLGRTIDSDLQHHSLKDFVLKIDLLYPTREPGVKFGILVWYEVLWKILSIYNNDLKLSHFISKTWLRISSTSVEWVTNLPTQIAPCSKMF